MSECQSDSMRDQLPLLVRGLLPVSAAAPLRSHVAQCASCTAELALLERSARVFDAATPRVDVSAILAKLPSAPAASARPVLTVSGGTRQRFGLPRYLLAAAASLVLVATLSLSTIREGFFTAPVATGGAPDSSAPVVATLPVGLVGGNELGDLGADQLETLLSELDGLEATVAAEPITMQRPVSAAPEGL